MRSPCRSYRYLRCKACSRIRRPRTPAVARAVCRTSERAADRGADRRRARFRADTSCHPMPSTSPARAASTAEVTTAARRAAGIPAESRSLHSPTFRSLDEVPEQHRDRGGTDAAHARGDVARDLDTTLVHVGQQRAAFVADAGTDDDRAGRDVLGLDDAGYTRGGDDDVRLARVP